MHDWKLIVLLSISMPILTFLGYYYWRWLPKQSSQLKGLLAGTQARRTVPLYMGVLMAFTYLVIHLQDGFFGQGRVDFLGLLAGLLFTALLCAVGVWLGLVIAQRMLNGRNSNDSSLNS